MKFVQVLLICASLFKKSSCEMITTYNSSLANRRQQMLIKSSMDLSAQPCEDFYQYACGNWEYLHKEAGNKYKGLLDLLEFNNNKEMVRAFRRMNLRNQPKFIQRAYQYFKSCNDLKVYATFNYLKWITAQENMKFPSLRRAQKMPEKFDWLRTLAVMNIYGMNGIFIEEYVVQRIDDPSKFIIYLNKPSKNGGFTALTRDNLEQITIYSGETITPTALLKLWRQVQEFEVQLQQLDYIKDVAGTNETELIKKFNDLPLVWLKDYIKILLNKTELNPNMEIYIQNTNYFMALDDLMKQYRQRFLCKYLKIRFLWHLNQQKPQNLTAEDCAANVRSVLPMAMHWLYEHEHPVLQLEFPKITELYEGIRKHFKETIQKNDHGLSETTVSQLLAILNDMQFKLSYTRRLDAVQSLENFYDSLELNVSTFYANHLKLMKFNFIASHNLLSNTTHEIDLVSFERSGIGKTSLPYRKSPYTLLFPLRLLQSPLYQPGFDDIYIYSSLGFMLVYKMYSAFENIALEFVDSGVSQRNAIITNPLIDAGLNCYLKSGISKTDEAMAHSLHYSYKIFSDSRTADMDVSLSKLFFLNYAQLLCRNPPAYDANSRDSFTNMLTHISEFSKVFQCNTPTECS